jgi:hypothetical protein
MEEDFEDSAEFVQALEIVINGEVRLFMDVTNIKQGAFPVKKSEITLDGVSRPFEFDSIMSVQLPTGGSEDLKTHTRCFGIAVLIDEIVESNIQKSKPHINDISYE